MLKLGLEVHFGVIQIRTGMICEILIFRDFLGVKVQTFVIFNKFWTLTPWKKLQKIKISRIAAVWLCITPNMYLQTKFQHERTCRFLDPLCFMYRKCIVFSVKCTSSYIWQYPLDVNHHNIKSNYSWVKCDPILERRKIGL